MPVLMTPEELQREFGGPGRDTPEPAAGWGTRFGAAVDRFQAGLYGVGEAATGSETLGRLRRENQAAATANRARAIRDTGAPDSYRDVGSVGDAARYVGGLLVDSSPELAVTLASGGAGAVAGVGAAGRVALAAGASAPSAMGDILQNQREEAGKTDLLSASALTVPYVAADMLGLDAALASGRLTRAGIKALDDMQGVKGVAARSAATFLKAAPVEGAGELGQELVNQAGRIAVNPDQTFFNPEANDRYQEAFVGGAAVGGTVSTALGGWNRTQAPAASAPAAQPAQGLPALGYDPRAGAVTTYADGSSAVSSEASPLGDITQAYQAEAPNTQGAAEIEAVQAAQAEAVQAAQRPPTPEQQRVQAVKEVAARTAFEAQARDARGRNEFGITKPAALTTYGDLEEAHVQGLIDDQQFGVMAGLLSGTATGMGKVRKALNDLRKEQEAARLRQEQATRVAQADADQKTADAAKLQRAAAPATPPATTQGAPADVPSPAQPGTQASQAPSAQAAPQAGPVAQTPVAQTPAVAPDRAIEVGRSDRRKAITAAQLDQKLRAANDRDRFRMLALMGAEVDVDPSTGQPTVVYTSAPRTFDEVAALEAERTGKKVTRQAVQQAMAKFGITQEVVDRLAAEQNPDTVSEAELGIQNTDDGELRDGSGFRVESSLSKAAGEGLLQEQTAETAEQKAARTQADALLKAAGESQETDQAADPAAQAEQAARNAAITAENARLLDEVNAEARQRKSLRDLLPTPLQEEVDRAAEDFAETMMEGDVAWQGLPASLQAQWVKAFVAWDTSAIDTRTFNRIYEDIQNEARDTQQRARSQGSAPGEGADRSATGGDGGALPARDVRDPGQEAGAGQPAARAAQGQADGADPVGSQAAAQARDPAAVNREVLDAVTNPRNEEVLTNLRFNRRKARTVAGLLDAAGDPVRITPTDLETLADDPRVQRVLDHYTTNGLDNVLDSVLDWYVTDQQVDFNGAYMQIDGRPSMVLPTSELASPNLPMTLHHELGHAVDLISGQGDFSARPQLNLRVETDSTGNESVRGFGPVAREVIDQVRSDPDSMFATIMEYPLDRTLHADLDAEGVRQEVFAQLWLLYNARAARSYITTNMPLTAAFMENVVNEIKTGPDFRAATAALRAPQAGGQPGGAGQAGGGVQAGSGQTPPRYSRQARAVTPPQARQIESAAATFWDALKTGAKDATSWVALRASFTKDLAARAASVLPSVRKYIELVEANAVEKTRAEREVEAVLDLYNTLPRHERGTGPGSVNAFLQASTTERKWGYQPDYLDNVQVDPAMAAQFNGLSAAAQNLVKRVFQHGHDNLQNLQRAVQDNVASEFDALIADLEKMGDLPGAAKAAKDKQKSLQEFGRLLSMESTWPYAPLRRFGNHVVVGMSQAYLDAEEAGDTKLMDKLKRDADHYFVAFRGTKGEARKARDEISGRYAYVDNFAKDEAHSKLYGGRDMLSAFGRLRGLVKETQDDRLTGKANAALNRLMVDLQLSLLADQSARQAERQRLNVAGADKDMMRAFATQGRASAHFISALKSNGAISEQLLAMRREADARAPGREQRREFYNELLARHVMGMEYAPSPIVDKAMAASSVWMLLTSPAYFLTNATQPFAMTLPVLAGRHGYAKSAGALRKAYMDLLPLVKDGTITQDDYTSLPADVRDDVKALADRGFIDISLESDLGRWRSEEETAGSKVLGTVTSKMRNVTQTVEAVNRLATAVAALRLERENAGGNPLAYAGKVIYDTHGDYTGFNAPRVMRTPVGRLVTQFRKFQLIQISMYAKLLNQAFKGASPEERSVARAALGYSLTTMFALGGLLGMPGAQAIGWVLRQAFGDDDEPDNPELTLRRMIGDDTLADLLTKGVPKMVGLDLSGRLGAGGMLSLLPYADTSLDRKGYEAAAVAALGPFFGGMLPRMADGVGLMRQGEFWMGMEQLLPKGLSDVSKAVRFNVEGVTSRRGDMLMQPEDVSELATLGQLIGLPTTTLTDRQFRSNAVYTSDKHFQDRATRLKREYTEAVRGNDVAALQETRARWAALQEARREYGYKVQPLSDLLRAPQEQAKRDRQVVNGVVYKRDNRGLADQLGE